MPFRYSPLLVLIIVLSVVWRPAKAQTSSYPELQAAYMYNFAKYISWPTEAPQFVIGIFEDADIMLGLETTLKGKKVRSKPIVLKIVTTLDELLECNIVYLSESHSKSINKLTDAMRNKSILIVTEEDLVRKGATISFLVKEDRLKFKVNVKALKQVGLVASEGLLNLAILY